MTRRKIAYHIEFPKPGETFNGLISALLQAGRDDFVLESGTVATDGSYIIELVETPIIGFVSTRGESEQESLEPVIRHWKTNTLTDAG